MTSGSGAPAVASETPLPNADFTDAYSAHVAEPLDALQAARRMVGRRPRWVDGLLVLRNLAVTPFGLKRGASIGAERIGIFPVVSASTERVVMGFDDAHLDFRVVVGFGVLCRCEPAYVGVRARNSALAGRRLLSDVEPGCDRTQVAFLKGAPLGSVLPTEPVPDRSNSCKQGCPGDSKGDDLDENVLEQVAFRDVMPGGRTEGMTELLHHRQEHAKQSAVRRKVSRIPAALGSRHIVVLCSI